MMRAFRRSFVTGVSIAVACFAASGFAGCGETSGDEVVFRFAVAATSDTAGASHGDGSPAVFTTSTGWDVTLHEAVVALGPVYFQENPPHHATTGAWPLLERLVNRFSALWIRPAYAHVGDGHEGDVVLAEWLEQVAVDVTVPDVRVLGEITGNEATVHSFSIHLEPPREPLVQAGDPTRGFPIHVTGEASKDGTTVRFRGGLTLMPDRSRIEELETELTLGAGGTLVLEIHPPAWFDTADFDSLPPEEDSEGYRSIDPESQVHEAWISGARSHRAFSAHWMPGEED